MKKAGVDDVRRDVLGLGTMSMSFWAPGWRKAAELEARPSREGASLLDASRRDLRSKVGRELGGEGAFVVIRRIISVMSSWRWRACWAVERALDVKN